jgi:hypothetical protein
VLGIVVTVYRRYEYLTEYLKRLAGNEIAVVDIDPVSGYETQVEHTRVVVPKCSYAKAVNTGLRLLRSNVICFSNDDIIAEDACFTQRLEEFLCLHPTSIVGIKTESGYAEGSFVAMNRRALSDIGFLDERFPGCYEDVDFSRRAVNAGYDLVEMELGLRHVDLGQLDGLVYQSLAIYKEKWNCTA